KEELCLVELWLLKELDLLVNRGKGTVKFRPKSVLQHVFLGIIAHPYFFFNVHAYAVEELGNTPSISFLFVA
ncbi:hypothetical protein ACJX0J_040914, partial [Zea mays]